MEVEEERGAARRAHVGPWPYCRVAAIYSESCVVLSRVLGDDEQLDFFLLCMRLGGYYSL